MTNNRWWQTQTTNSDEQRTTTMDKQHRKATPTNDNERPAHTNDDPRPSPSNDSTSTHEKRQVPRNTTHEKPRSPSSTTHKRRWVPNTTHGERGPQTTTCKWRPTPPLMNSNEGLPILPPSPFNIYLPPNIWSSIVISLLVFKYNWILHVHI